LIFFRGDGYGAGTHEHLARKIAISGRNWSKTFWRKEDLASYMFRFVPVFSLSFVGILMDSDYRLTLEYARLMSVDREAMTYYHERAG